MEIVQIIGKPSEENCLVPKRVLEERIQCYLFIRYKDVKKKEKYR